MRFFIRILFVTLFVLGGLAVPAPRVFAANLDTTADRVYGQINFNGGTANNPTLSAHSLSGPSGMVLDAHGNLYVADFNNNRVLEYNAPLRSGADANRVFGQPDFVSSAINNGGLTANSLYGPGGVAIDALGNLYVADGSNNRVLEYNAPLASPPSAGSGDTTADRVFGQPNFTSNAINNTGINAAGLYFPFGVAVDVQLNLYVADYDNSRVLEYNNPFNSDASADMVFGQADFSTNAANHGGLNATSLSFPTGVALDMLGNLYVADTFNNRVLEYNTPLLTTGTSAGDATADFVLGQPGFTTNVVNNGGISDHGLDFPSGVALDLQGNLYVADYLNNRVLETNAPLVTNASANKVFGQPDYATKIPNTNDHGLNNPHGVALDAYGNLYAADWANHRVLEYDLPMPYGVPVISAISPTTVAVGSPAFTLAVHGAGFVPASIVGWNGVNRPTTYISSTVLTASITAADVASIGPAGVTVFTPYPGGGTSLLLDLPLYVRSGQDATADGVLGQPNFQSNLPNNPLLAGPANRLSSPISAAIDPHSGRLFVGDSENHRVLSWPNGSAFANSQAADLVLGQPDFTSNAYNNGGLSDHNLSSPGGMAVDAQGNLYVGDTFNNRLLEFKAPLTNGMAASLVFGQGGSFTTRVLNKGGDSADSLYYPSGMAVDAQGNLYVVDIDNSRVLEYNTPLAATGGGSGDTTADRVFGEPDFTTTTSNNSGTSADTLYAPQGLALDAQGNLFIADTGNNRVLEYNAPLITPGGTRADRVYGQPGFTTFTDNNGGLSANSLKNPHGLGLDSQGNLYVADYFNSRVLEYFDPLTNATADRVFGQPDFISNAINNGGVSAHSLVAPVAVAVDTQRNLTVADTDNNRLLEYDAFFSKNYLAFINP